MPCDGVLRTAWGVASRAERSPGLRILFVCTGNICRSAMAEAFARDMLEGGNGKCEALFSSAGLEAVEGEVPPEEVVKVMRDLGLDVSGHRAKRLTENDVEESDLILAMAMHNSSRLLTRHQEAVEKVFTLKEFVIQGEPRGRDLSGRDPEERLRELRRWIRHIEGLDALLGSGGLNAQLQTFFLHYFHLYDHRFTIDDPLGQSTEFMRKTALEIKEAVYKLLGPDLLALVPGGERAR